MQPNTFTDAFKKKVYIQAKDAVREIQLIEWKVFIPHIHRFGEAQV